MESQKAAIAKTLLAIARKYGKAYCTPSQAKINKLLRKRHHIKRSIRTLNRRLREMQDDGDFTRTRRHRRGKDGKMIFCSTLYTLGGKIFNWAYQESRFFAGVFSFFHVPKMAQYRDGTARYPSSVDNLARLITSVLQKGAPPAAINSG
jgi:hypothetical protein